MSNANQKPEAPTSRPRRSAVLRWVVGGLVVALVAGIGIGVWQLWPRPEGAGGRTFNRTVQAQQGTQTLSVSLEGTLSPRKQSQLDFAVSGTVTSVKVKVGDHVAKGAKLAVVEASSLSDALELAEANLASAKASLTEARDNDASDAAINAASAQVNSARAAVKNAEQNLKDTVLRSPIAGTVAEVNLAVGDTVSGGSQTNSGSMASGTSSGDSSQFVVIATSKWQLDGSVSAADLGGLKAGQSAVVSINGSDVEGEVASVGIVATSTNDGTSTFPVVVNLSGTHHDLFSGTTASAVITTASYPDVLTVPTAAVTSQDDQTFVTRVDGDSTSQVEVQVGRVFGPNTEITSGISAGDTVRISFVQSDQTQDQSGSEGGQQDGFGGGFPGLGGIPGGGAPPGGGPNPGSDQSGR